LIIATSLAIRTATLSTNAPSTVELSYAQGQLRPLRYSNVLINSWSCVQTPPRAKIASERPDDTQFASIGQSITMLYPSHPKQLSVTWNPAENEGFRGLDNLRPAFML
jgi:hypothetical protein